jgi:hypothetical protein
MIAELGRFRNPEDDAENIETGSRLLLISVCNHTGHGSFLSDVHASSCAGEGRTWLEKARVDFPLV